jgi:hypothetical protein
MTYGDSWKDCCRRDSIDTQHDRMLDDMHICTKLEFCRGAICENVIISGKCPEGYKLPDGRKQE